jgi:hypothetical protein
MVEASGSIMLRPQGITSQKTVIWGGLVPLGSLDRHEYIDVGCERINET